MFLKIDEIVDNIEKLARVNSLKIAKFALKMKIVLIGYMGSGKTSVGEILAEELEIPFRDLDVEIEKAEERSIPKIFKDKGEIYFRKAENRILKAVLSEPENFVLATGGGTPCYADSLSLMLDAEDTLTVYLKTPLSILCDRLFLEKDQRPLLAHLGSMEEMMEFIGIHLFERSHFYNQAGLIIDIGEDCPETIAKRIINNLL